MVKIYKLSSPSTFHGCHCVQDTLHASVLKKRMAPSTYSSSFCHSTWGVADRVRGKCGPVEKGRVRSESF